VGEKSQEAADSVWVLISNLPPRSSWNKVRGLFSTAGFTVVSGKVKRAEKISLVQMPSAEQARKAEEELSGKSFEDIPDAPMTARQISESERNKLDE